MLPTLFVTRYISNHFNKYCTHEYTILNFPSITYLEMHSVAFDRFPYFNHTSLTQLNMYYLTIPNRVTIQPSMLILPNLFLANGRIRTCALCAVVRSHSQQF